MPWDTLKTLFSPSTFELLNKIWNVVVKLWQPRGLYEVLKYEATLELLDPKGKCAIAHKQAHVRFLQDNIIAYQDQVWGEGEIFVDYRCSPGVPVDRYQEGNCWRVLISLRETKNRGDIETFHITREIHNGFPHKVENFQNKVNHVISEFTISVIFPLKHPPKRVMLIEENAARTYSLNTENIQTLPDGRQKVMWQTKRPIRYEIYTLRWER